MIKILAFSGSARANSFNQMTVNAIVEFCTGEVTHLNLRDLALPIYDGDLEDRSGLPESAKALRTLIKTHDALVIGCPEYNGFMTPLLLNAIDWASRSEQTSPDTSIFKDKLVLICSTSPGALSGMRAASHLKTLLGGIGMLVLPDLFAIPGSHKAFDEQGRLVDEAQQLRARQIALRLEMFTTKLQQP